MILSFTGTRHGLTDAQRATLRSRLSSIDPTTSRAHHGCCVGADAEFDAIGAELGFPRTAPSGHPDARCEVVST